MKSRSDGDAWNSFFSFGLWPVGVADEDNYTLPSMPIPWRERTQLCVVRTNPPLHGKGTSRGPEWAHFASWMDLPLFARDASPR